MKDLTQALQDRAGRCAPIGSDRLRQRVALTLAAEGRAGLVLEQTRRAYGPLVAIAAAAATLIAIGAVVWLLRGSGETPIVDEAPSPTVPVTTSPLAPTTVPPVTTAVPPTTTTSSTATTGPTAATTTSTGMTAATPTSLVPRSFDIWIAPPDGTHFREQPMPWPVWGYVRPEAAVTVSGVSFEVWRPTDQSSCAEDPNCWRWGSRWYGTTGDPGGIVLEEGRNVLVFQASFVDGSTLQEQRIVYYDPTLERITGHILDITSVTPPRITIEIATLEYGEWGVEQTSDETTIAEFVVSDGTGFMVFGRDQSRLGFDLEGIFQLAESAAGGAPLEDLHWRAIYPDGVNTPTPWEFLITPDGQLQQANQLYSP